MPFARLSDVRLHYRIDGNAASPPLVLFNSLGTSLEMWEPQMTALAARYRVVRYDSRGHGQSEVTSGPYTIEQLATDAARLLDALSIQRAHVCGLSMGGGVAMWLAINAPERVDRLVLANTGAKIGTSEMWNARIEAVERGGTASIAPAVLARFFTPQAVEQPTPLIAQIRATFEATSAEGYVACCAAVRDMDLRHLLGRIRAPTLVVTGSDDVSTPPEVGRFIADHVRGARYVELSAPHLSNVQAAPAFTQALLQFLSGARGVESRGDGH